MRSELQLLIFDLDGTLIDSKRDLVCAVNATRDHMGLGPLDDHVVASYVGNGAPMLVRRSLGPAASEPDVERALEFFLAWYRAHPLDHTTLYPTVRETLEELHRGGRSLAVLTNKPVRLSRVILEGLGVAGYFFQVYGGNSFPEKKPHPIGVQTLLAESGTSAERAVMIGDSTVDIQTARNAGIRSCGVTYGFQPETLSAPAPDIVIESLHRILDFVDPESRRA